MSARIRLKRQAPALTIAAAFLLGVLPTEAQAQGNPAKPAANPAAKRSGTAAAPAQSADYWSVNTSLGSQYGGTPARSRAVERSQTPTISTEMTSEFGRIPVQTGPGSVGFAAGQSASSGRFQDGRSVPGLNPNTQKESSFVGMSLTVPTTSKGLPIPLPVGPTPWNRNE